MKVINLNWLAFKIKSANWQIIAVKLGIRSKVFGIKYKSNYAIAISSANMPMCCVMVRMTSLTNWRKCGHRWAMSLKKIQNRFSVNSIPFWTKLRKKWSKVFSGFQIFLKIWKKRNLNSEIKNWNANIPTIFGIGLIVYSKPSKRRNLVRMPLMTARRVSVWLVDMKVWLGQWIKCKTVLTAIKTNWISKLSGWITQLVSLKPKFAKQKLRWL